MTAVLDASAVLALIYREPGHERVAEQLDGAVISTVNYAEVVQKLAQKAHPAPEQAAEALGSLGVHVLPFTRAAAVASALLWQTTHSAGLSLGDRACLAVAAGIPNARAVTTDRAWTTVAAGVPVDLIR